MYLHECGLFLAVCGATDLRNGFVATGDIKSQQDQRKRLSPAKIPHRLDVDHLDEEVLYVDVQ
jgi:hypothetical protein